jgi:hypothetical protein
LANNLKVLQSLADKIIAMFFMEKFSILYYRLKSCLSIKQDRGPFDQKSVDRNCVFSVDQNFHNQLTKILDGFQLIETFNNEFDQMPKI